jgi:4-azaleucine resistance transporter AzlC
MTRSAFAQTLKITLPVFFGYISIGIPFGLLAVKSGYPLFLAVLMSVFIFAGAGQFMAIGLFASGASVPSILVAKLLLNIRHIVYGLSLIEPFKEAGKWKPYVIYTLSDETYALLTTATPPEGMKKGDFYGLVSLLDQSYWVAGTIIGGVAGSLIPFSFAGVDFALTALFAVLLIEQIKKTRDPLPVAVGGAVTVGAIFALPGEHVLLGSLAAGIAALMLLRRREGGKKNGGDSIAAP